MTVAPILGRATVSLNLVEPPYYYWSGIVWLGAGAVVSRLPP